MHILFIPSWYSSPQQPTSGVFFRDQAAALRDAGHQVGVLLHAYSAATKVFQQGPFPSISRVDQDGLPVYWARQLKFFPKTTVLYQQMLTRLGLAAYRRYAAEQGRPEVLHAHSILYGGYLAAHIKRRESIPAVMTEHLSTIFSGQVNPMQRETIRFTLRAMDGSFAVSQALSGVLRNYAPERTVGVIGNLVDGELFSPVPGQALPARPFVFAVAAGLSANKGLDVLLRAFARLGPGKKALLRVAGDGPERGNLNRLARELGIADRVEFLGAIPHERMPEMLRGCHALVSTSYVETFGVTLIEAQSCGKPVIATRSGGPEDIVDESNGLLVPPGDVLALAAAMEQLMDTYSRYDAGTIRAGCLERFGKGAIVRQLEDAYRDALGCVKPCYNS